MMKQKQNLGKWISNIINQYQQIHTIHTSKPYRLVDVSKDKKGNVQLIVQVTGKSSTFKLTPAEILADDKLVEQFTSRDIRTITYYGCQVLKRPSKKIIFKRYCEKINKMIFGVENLENSHIEELTASAISANSLTVKELSPEDAHLIGYVASQDLQSDEKKLFTKIRNEKKES